MVRFTGRTPCQGDGSPSWSEAQAHALVQAAAAGDTGAFEQLYADLP